MKHSNAFRHAGYLVLLALLPACGHKYVFRSDPSEAEVYLNDTHVGKTPLELSLGDLPQTHNIHLRMAKEGFVSFDGIIPSPSISTLGSDVLIALSRGEDETDKLNRNMGLIINAQKLLVTRKYPEALKLVDQAIAENPRYLYAQLLKGSIYFLSKDFTAAMTQFQKVIELSPSNTEAIRMVNYLRETGGVGAPRSPASATGAPAK